MTLPQGPDDGIAEDQAAAYRFETRAADQARVFTAAGDQHFYGVPHRAPGPRRARGRLLVAGAAALVIVVAIVTVVLRPWNHGREPSSAGVLRATVTSITGPNGGASMAFADLSGDAKHYAQLPRVTIEQMQQGQLTAEGLRDGAFLLAGAEMTVSLEGLGDSQLVVSGVRPHNLQAVPYPASLLLLIPSQGETDAMLIDLDRPSPIARVMDGEPDEGQPYFQRKYIALGKGERAVLAISAVALRRAYTFQIAVDYEYGGTQHTLILSQDGTPTTFRVAPGPCNAYDKGKVRDEAERRYFDALRFGSVKVLATTGFDSEGWPLVEHPDASACGPDISPT